MKDDKIDISGQKSQSLEDYLEETFDYVITLCSNAEERCPQFPGRAQRLHWPIDDPVSATGDDSRILEAFTSARDEIKKKIVDFLSGLTKRS